MEILRLMWLIQVKIEKSLIFFDFHCFEQFFGSAPQMFLSQWHETSIFKNRYWQ